MVLIETIDNDIFLDVLRTFVRNDYKQKRPPVNQKVGGLSVEYSPQRPLHGRPCVIVVSHCTSAKFCSVLTMINQVTCGIPMNDSSMIT